MNSRGKRLCFVTNTILFKNTELNEIDHIFTFSQFEHSYKVTNYDPTPVQSPMDFNISLAGIT